MNACEILTWQGLEGPHCLCQSKHTRHGRRKRHCTPHCIEYHMQTCQTLVKNQSCIPQPGNWFDCTTNVRPSSKSTLLLPSTLTATLFCLMSVVHTNSQLSTIFFEYNLKWPPVISSVENSVVFSVSAYFDENSIQAKYYKITHVNQGRHYI